MINVFLCGTEYIDSADKAERILSSLPSWRKSAVPKTNNNNQRLLGICAGFLYCRALNSFGIDWTDAAVNFNENGKPCLADRPDISFSISHSGNMAMCCIADCKVGCDTERVRESGSRIAKRFFTTNEQKYIMQSPDPDSEFTRIWTAKESYIKMLGKGISLCPPRSFEIDCSDTLSVKNSDAVFYEAKVRNGYFVTVCSNKKSVINFTVL